MFARTEKPRNTGIQQSTLRPSTRAPESENIEKTACITNVNNGIWGNPRKVVGIRCDSGLYEAFKPVARRYFGSVCNAFESYMAGVVGVASNPNVNISNRFVIHDGFHVHRNLREKRRLDPSALFDFPGEGVEVVNLALNHFEARFHKWGVKTSRREVLQFFRDKAPDVDGKLRMIYTTRVLDELRYIYLKSSK